MFNVLYLILYPCPMLNEHGFSSRNGSNTFFVVSFEPLHQEMLHRLLATVYDDPYMQDA